ncbi:MAG: hypothetical protein KAJ10_00790 [Thermodesulfovibrionia bacterium]|nr:hypothetical protein [Thermodesulfovibrionia bacterium]
MRYGGLFLRYLSITLSTVSLVFAFAGCEQTPENINTYDPAPYEKLKLDDWAKFNERFQNKWRVTWNPSSGTPHRISGYHIKISEAVTRKNVEKLTRKILSDHRKLLQIYPASLKLKRADFRPPRDPKGGVGTWYVSYSQTYRGLPVYGGTVSLVLRGRKLTVMGSDFYPEIWLNTEPTVSREQAVDLVNKDIAVKKRLEPVDMELVILPRAYSGVVRYHLAWKATMPVIKLQGRLLEEGVGREEEGERGKEMAPVKWQYFIDARAGVIINRFNLLRYDDLNGTVKGIVYPASPCPAPRKPFQYLC